MVLQGVHTNNNKPGVREFRKTFMEAWCHATGYVEVWSSAYTYTKSQKIATSEGRERAHASSKSCPSTACQPWFRRALSSAAKYGRWTLDRIGEAAFLAPNWSQILAHKGLVAGKLVTIWSSEIELLGVLATFFLLYRTCAEVRKRFGIRNLVAGFSAQSLY